MGIAGIPEGMPSLPGFQHPLAGPGDDHFTARKRAESAADDIRVFVLVVTAAQRRRQGVEGHGRVRHIFLSIRQDLS